MDPVKEELTKAGQNAVQDDSVKNVTLEHADEHGVPTKEEAKEPLTNEKIEQQRKTKDSGGGSDSAVETASDQQSQEKPKLTIQAYKGDPNKKDEGLPTTDAESTGDPIVAEGAVVPTEQQNKQKIAPAKRNEINKKPGKKKQKQAFKGTPKKAKTYTPPQPAVQPTVEAAVQPVQPTVEAAVQPVQPTVEAVVQPPVQPVQPAVQQPVVQPPVQPTVQQPVVQPPVQQPVVQPPVQPTVQQPVVQPPVQPAVTPAVTPAGKLSMDERRAIGAKVDGDLAPTTARPALDKTAENTIGMGGLDKFKTGLDMTSSTLGLAGTLTGIGGSGGYGGDSDKAKKADSTASGLSLASDSISAVNSVISIGQDIKGFTENDKFTTTGTKAKQGLGFIGDVAGGAATVANMGSTIKGFEEGDQAQKDSGKWGIASNSLGLLSNGLGFGVEAANISGNNSDSKALQAQMAKAGTSEEFKKYAQHAQDAKSIQNTKSGINMAKSAAGFFGNATGLASSIGKSLGVKDDSTTGKWLKGFGLAGSLVSSLVGTAATFFGSKKVADLKNKRTEEGIDQYLDTGDLQKKILDKGHNLSLVETRKVAKTHLGFKTSDEMFSAILLQYATTIRKNALSGTEKDQYKVLIESLGFKLGATITSDTDLPEASAIAAKLGGG